MYCCFAVQLRENGVYGPHELYDVCEETKIATDVWQNTDLTLLRGTRATVVLSLMRIYDCSLVFVGKFAIRTAIQSSRDLLHRNSHIVITSD